MHTKKRYKRCLKIRIRTRLTLNKKYLSKTILLKYSLFFLLLLLVFLKLIYETTQHIYKKVTIESIITFFLDFCLFFNNKINIHVQIKSEEKIKTCKYLSERVRRLKSYKIKRFRFS